MAAFAEAGVTTLNITPLGGTPAERVALVGRREGTGRRPVTGRIACRTRPAPVPVGITTDRGGTSLAEVRRTSTSCAPRWGRTSAPATWVTVDQQRIDRLRRRHRRPPVDPHRPRARGRGPVRADRRPRLPHRGADARSSAGTPSRSSGVSMTVNYGLNKVRFPAPVPVGSRVRGHSPPGGSHRRDERWRAGHHRGDRRDRGLRRSRRASPRSSCATCSEHPRSRSDRREAVVVEAVVCEPIRTPVGGFGGVVARRRRSRSWGRR